MKKKLLSAVVSAVMVTGSMAFMPQTQENFKAEAVSYSNEMVSGNLIYKQVDEDEDGKFDYIEISSCSKSVTSVDVPAEINELPVKSIGEKAFYECMTLENITLPDSIEQINADAFGYCEALKSIEIPDNVTVIGNSAFLECTNLEEVQLSQNLMSIGDSAFRVCSSLKTITIPETVTSIDNNAFYECTTLESITFPDRLEYISAGSLSYCEALKTIKIPDSVTTIGDSAFFGCISLEEVQLSANLTAIGNSVFKECISLKTLTIAETVTSIGDNAFYDCAALESIVIPDSVTEMGGAVFYSCESLKDVTLSENISDLSCYGSNGFFGNCTSLENIIIPKSVGIIEKYTFLGCENLKTITIGNPDCEIPDGEIGESVTIYGYENSSAHVYAVKYGNEFVSLGEAPVTPEEPELTAELSNKITTQSLEATIITNIEGCTFEITQEQGFGWGASEIFSVDENGVIKWEFVGGYAAGTVTITSPQGQTLDLQFGAELVDKCSFKNNEMTLAVGETVKLEYNATAWTNAKFSSSDESIVSVKDNIITAVAPGTAVITGTPGFAADDFVTVTVTGEAMTDTSGDANGDNELNVRDCAFIAKALAKGTASTLPASADFNGDGEVSVRDAAAIAVALAKAKK